ncbi:MAG TPA: response regulator [Myxococcota bacterium]
MSGRSLLIVDDDDVFRERLAKSFAARGYDVRTAADGAVALQLAQQESPELALVDLRMPGPSGLDVVEALAGIDAATRVVVLTGWGSVPTAVDALKKGAHFYLQKPASLAEIEAAFGDDPVAVQAGGDDDIPSLARNEWEYLQRALADSQGNISEAARRLGLHRRSLQRKLQKYPPAR